jgi:hypothetical protein
VRQSAISAHLILTLAEKLVAAREIWTPAVRTAAASVPLAWRLAAVALRPVVVAVRPMVSRLAALERLSGAGCQGSQLVRRAFSLRVRLAVLWPVLSAQQVDRLAASE